MSDSTQDTTSVLFVCTGNICRSPIAEAMLKASAISGVHVSSAGLLFDDRPASDGAIEWGEHAGMDLTAHRSRVINRSIVQTADLVLGMEPRHVREVVALHDPAWAYTFTLVEFVGRCLRHGPRQHGEPIAGWLRRLSAERDRIDLLADDPDLTVFDPYGLGFEVYERTAARIGELLAAVIANCWPEFHAAQAGSDVTGIPRW